MMQANGCYMDSKCFQ